MGDASRRFVSDWTQQATHKQHSSRTAAAAATARSTQRVANRWQRHEIVRECDVESVCATAAAPQWLAWTASTAKSIGADTAPLTDYIDAASPALRASESDAHALSQKHDHQNSDTSDGNGGGTHNEALRARLRPQSAAASRAQEPRHAVERTIRDTKRNARPQSAKPLRPRSAARSASTAGDTTRHCVSSHVLPSAIHDSKWTDMLFRSPDFEQSNLLKLEQETYDLLQRVFKRERTPSGSNQRHHLAAPAAVASTMTSTTTTPAAKRTSKRKAQQHPAARSNSFLAPTLASDAKRATSSRHRENDNVPCGSALQMARTKKNVARHAMPTANGLPWHPQTASNNYHHDHDHPQERKRTNAPLSAQPATNSCMRGLLSASKHTTTRSSRDNDSKIVPRIRDDDAAAIRARVLQEMGWDELVPLPPRQTTTKTKKRAGHQQQRNETHTRDVVTSPRITANHLQRVHDAATRSIDSVCVCTEQSRSLDVAILATHSTTTASELMHNSSHNTKSDVAAAAGCDDLDLDLPPVCTPAATNEHSTNSVEDAVAADAHLLEDTSASLGALPPAASSSTLSTAPASYREQQQQDYEALAQQEDVEFVGPTMTMTIAVTPRQLEQTAKLNNASASTTSPLLYSLSPAAPPPFILGTKDVDTAACVDGAVVDNSTVSNAVRNVREHSLNDNSLAGATSDAVLEQPSVAASTPSVEITTIADRPKHAQSSSDSVLQQNKQVDTTLLSHTQRWVLEQTLADRSCNANDGVTRVDSVALMSATDEQNGIAAAADDSVRHVAVATTDAAAAQLSPASLTLDVVVDNNEHSNPSLSLVGVFQQPVDCEEPDDDDDERDIESIVSKSHTLLLVVCDKSADEARGPTESFDEPVTTRDAPLDTDIDNEVSADVGRQSSDSSLVNEADSTESTRVDDSLNSNADTFPPRLRGDHTSTTGRNPSTIATCVDRQADGLCDAFHATTNSDSATSESIDALDKRVAVYTTIDDDDQRQVMRDDHKEQCTSNDLVPADDARSDVTNHDETNTVDDRECSNEFFLQVTECPSHETMACGAIDVDSAFVECLEAARSTTLHHSTLSPTVQNDDDVVGTGQADDKHRGDADTQHCTIESMPTVDTCECDAANQATRDVQHAVVCADDAVDFCNPNDTSGDAADRQVTANTEAAAVNTSNLLAAATQAHDAVVAAVVHRIPADDNHPVDAAIPAIICLESSRADSIEAHTNVPLEPQTSNIAVVTARERSELPLPRLTVSQPAAESTPRTSSSAQPLLLLSPAGAVESDTVLNEIDATVMSEVIVAAPAAAAPPRNEPGNAGSHDASAVPTTPADSVESLLLVTGNACVASTTDNVARCAAIEDARDAGARTIQRQYRHTTQRRVLVGELKFLLRQHKRQVRKQTRRVSKDVALLLVGDAASAPKTQELTVTRPEPLAAQATATATATSIVTTCLSIEQSPRHEATSALSTEQMPAAAPIIEVLTVQRTQDGTCGDVVTSDALALALSEQPHCTHDDHNLFNDVLIPQLPSPRTIGVDGISSVEGIHDEQSVQLHTDSLDNDALSDTTDVVAFAATPDQVEHDDLSDAAVDDDSSCSSDQYTIELSLSETDILSDDAVRASNGAHALAVLLDDTKHVDRCSDAIRISSTMDAIVIASSTEIHESKHERSAVALESNDTEAALDALMPVEDDDDDDTMRHTSSLDALATLAVDDGVKTHLDDDAVPYDAVSGVNDSDDVIALVNTPFEPLANVNGATALPQSRTSDVDDDVSLARARARVASIALAALAFDDEDDVAAIDTQLVSESAAQQQELAAVAIIDPSAAAIDTTIGGYWEHYVDAATNKSYYYNPQTQASQWTVPESSAAIVVDLATDAWGSNTIVVDGIIQQHVAVVETTIAAVAGVDYISDLDDSAVTEAHESASAEQQWRLLRHGSHNAETRGEWQAFTDSASNATFYYNAHTGESTWDPPAAFQTSTSSINTNECEWAMYMDEVTGADYFANIVTGETTWEKPAAFAAAEVAAVNEYALEAAPAGENSGSGADAVMEDDYVIRIDEHSLELLDQRV